jgi:RNA polymerase sigma-70 factor, ECF subfamily
MSGRTSTDHSHLALAARAGDRAALARLVQGTQADVWRFCAGLAGPGDADDLTQEVYLRAIGSLPRFRGDAPVLMWLLAIARRVCADHVRRSIRQRRLAERAQGEQHRFERSGAGDPTVVPDLSAIIGELPEAFRTAFVLTQVVGCTYAETAEVCGCPIGTVRSRVARAREAIVEGLGGAWPAESGG